MKVILLSGGSGKRLWPLSNDLRSKQFLKVLKDDRDNTQSMIQRVWGQIRKVNLENSTIIATSRLQAEIIRNQLEARGEIVIEPSRRDTFPAIALAASYLYSKKETDENEVISVLPVDPFVEDRFFDRLQDLERVLNESKVDIGLIGVKPTYPSSKYGYILPDNQVDIREYRSVQAFTEKPTEECAEKLINEGALWNCGVFAFKLKYILDILKNMNFPIKYNELLSRYNDLPKNSFDYEVVENCKKITVLPYNGEWKDLGTWNTLSEEMSSNQIGKGNISTDCTNTHMINELDIPIAIIGASNLIVAASPDGILVSDKNSSPRIKDVVNNFSNRPMHVERRWGHYVVLDLIKSRDGNEVLTKRFEVNPGQNISYHFHNNRSELWTIISGEGIYALNGKLNKVKAGDVLYIKEGQFHGIKAITNLQIIEVQRGKELLEDDIVRLESDWVDIEKLCTYEEMTK
ncbi:sugar phosphate nucleotidyltransferase [Bacillus sp. KH172YL63]|uniref:sugar phosphate nucleotidyltransferase n=1 Tax=Bacillus sp. KH172YL63 TaxID=2709784 RepID=UPI0013E4941E|nr:sugar phosphate nucleotidyltransferase [Bacillus sp. KH172YL63]BCB05862.1 mannose-1-phosphate guanylyltransferase [Bacillus sp. KH172YL63]